MSGRFVAKAFGGLAILACWIASLLLPTIDTQTSSGMVTDTGWTIAVVGWLGPLIGQFGWFANLILIPALGLAAGQFGRAPRAKPAVGVILLVLVLNSAFWTSVASDAGEQPIVAYRAGYWLWMLAMASAGLWLLGDHARDGALQFGDEQQ